MVFLTIDRPQSKWDRDDLSNLQPLHSEQWLVTHIPGWRNDIRYLAKEHIVMNKSRNRTIILESKPVVYIIIIKKRYSTFLKLYFAQWKQDWSHQIIYKSFFHSLYTCMDLRFLLHVLNRIRKCSNAPLPIKCFVQAHSINGHVDITCNE